MTQIINLGTTWRLGKDHGHRQLQSETQFFSFPVMCYESLPHNRVRVMLWVFAGSLDKRRTGMMSEGARAQTHLDVCGYQ